MKASPEYEVQGPPRTDRQSGTHDHVHVHVHVHVCNVFTCTSIILLHSLSGIKCVYMASNGFSCDYYAIPMTINMKIHDMYVYSTYNNYYTYKCVIGLIQGFF